MKSPAERTVRLIASDQPRNLREDFVGLIGRYLEGAIAEELLTLSKVELGYIELMTPLSQFPRNPMRNEHILSLMLSVVWRCL